MKMSDILYCSLLGLCNYVILKEVLTNGLLRILSQGFANPRVRRAVFLGLLITVAGGIAHRTADFNPDIKSAFNWCLVFVLPFALALIFRGKLDRGWSNLEKGKALWQSLPIKLPMGEIDPAAIQFRNHPKVLSAATLIRGAIDHAPSSNRDAIRAEANAAIAWQELGLLYRAINEFDEASNCFERSLHIIDSVPGSESNNTRILYARRDTLFRLAELNHVRGNHEKALDGYRASLAVDDLLGHDDPVGENTTRELVRKLVENP
jgi:tetratricopeptide (TPR) repeat protein